MLKHLLATVSVSLALTAHASLVELLLPTPWGVGIGIARWLHEGSEKIFYVEVVGEGNTADQARQQGFRLAVEHAVGTVIASETEVRGDRIARDEIITYASGYVDRFEIVQQQQLDNRVQVQMKIWVKHNKLANRLLNKSETQGSVDGGRIGAQLNSLQHARSSGDQLLKSVLADYPARAFDIKLDNTRVFFDANRNGQLEVAFYLSWNKLYLDSIASAITAINQRPDCAGLLGCTNITSTVKVVQPGFATNSMAWFDDRRAQDLIQKEMIRSRPTIRLSILDTQGKQQFKQCLYAKELDYSAPATMYYVKLGSNTVEINGHAVKRFNTFVDLSTVPTSQLDKVEITIVRGPGC